MTLLMLTSCPAVSRLNLRRALHAKPDTSTAEVQEVNACAWLWLSTC